MKEVRKESGCSVASGRKVAGMAARSQDVLNLGKFDLPLSLFRTFANKNELVNKET